MELELRPLTPALHPVVARLWQLYRHDLSEFRGTHGPGGFVGSLPDADGRYHERGLQPFLEPDDDRAAYVFYRGESPVGFALVSGVASPARLMADFFVVHGVRRHGVGRAAVAELFRRHPGTWGIPFQDANAAAARFWRGIGEPDAHEERRPVPGKPDVPHDVWLTVTR